MLLNRLKTIASVVIMLSSVAVTASSLNDYNIILSGDLNVSGGSGHVEGKSFIGGNFVNGSVLALNTDIHTGSNLNGANAANSYRSNGVIHDYHWNYTPPSKLRTYLPEPATGLLMLLGLTLIGFAIYLRRR